MSYDNKIQSDMHLENRIFNGSRINIPPNTNHRIPIFFTLSDFKLNPDTGIYSVENNTKTFGSKVFFSIKGNDVRYFETEITGIPEKINQDNISRQLFIGKIRRKNDLLEISGISTACAPDQALLHDRYLPDTILPDSFCILREVPRTMDAFVGYVGFDELISRFEEWANGEGAKYAKRLSRKQLASQKQLEKCILDFESVDESIPAKKPEIYVNY